MTADEILQVHAKNQGMDPRLLRGQAKEFLQSPKTQIFQQGDCLFLVKFEDDIGYFHIFNGGGATGYLRATRMFILLMKKLGYKKLAMRVDDKEQSTKIAKSVGASSPKYKHIGGKVDPYLMTMEI
jgi:hypothetical protein